jgi:acetylornithine/succinyldiaminopimelate/putrescine aminotransferase
LLCCVAGEHVVRFLPPLNVKEANIAEALEMIGDSLDVLYGGEGDAE